MNQKLKLLPSPGLKLAVSPLPSPPLPSGRSACSSASRMVTEEEKKKRQQVSRSLSLYISRFQLAKKEEDSPATACE